MAYKLLAIITKSVSIKKGPRLRALVLFPRFVRRFFVGFLGWFRFVFLVEQFDYVLSNVILILSIKNRFSISSTVDVIVPFLFAISLDGCFDALDHRIHLNCVFLLQLLEHRLLCISRFLLATRKFSALLLR